MMKKLTLKVEELKVESLEVDAAAEARGTVRGFSGETCTCACTVIAVYCYPDSNVMDCPFDPFASERGCVVDP